MMNERYLTDAAGNRVGVVLDMATWERIIEELEEADATRAYDAAITEQAGAEMIPLDKAIAEIEAEWAAVEQKDAQHTVTIRDVDNRKDVYR